MSEDQQRYTLLNAEQEFNMKSLDIKNAIEAQRPALEMLMNQSIPNLDELAKFNSEKHEALLQTAKSTKEINQKMESLNADLEKERQERKDADIKSNQIAFAALIICILSAIITNFDKIIGIVKWLLGLMK